MQNKPEPVTVKTLRKWQKRLGLMDWNIRMYTNVRYHNMESEGAEGHVQYSEEHRTARIQILDPDHWTLADFSFDQEKTLVHELLHIKFSLLDESDNPIQNRIVHQLIDDLARALVDAERSGSAQK